MEIERESCWFYLPLEQGLWMRLPSECYCTPSLARNQRMLAALFAVARLRLAYLCRRWRKWGAVPGRICPEEVSQEVPCITLWIAY